MKHIQRDVTGGEYAGGSADITVRCHSCGNKQKTKLQGTEPDGTKVIVINYCPNCESEHEGDFWEEMWCEDSNGNVLYSINQTNNQHNGNEPTI